MFFDKMMGKEGSIVPEELTGWMLWIIFAVLAAAAVVLLIKKLTN